MIRKGFRREIDSYSAFFENDRRTPDQPRRLPAGPRAVFPAGLAFVRFSAEDARNSGFTCFVITDACRGIDVGGSIAATHAKLAELGITLIEAASLT